MAAFPNPYGSEFGPDPSLRSYGMSMTPGLGSSSDILNIIMNMVMGQNIFPRPTGSNSIFDMAMMRQRNLDFHYIMQRSMVTNQIGATLGMKPGMFSAMTYPLISAPDSPIARMMAPLIGGNLAKAQMGLYADMTGMNYAAFGGIGNISGGATDRMMENLQGVFYKPDGAGPNRRYAGGIDYRVSRGFNIEDFTQAFAGAGKYNLVGRGTSINDIGKFTKQSGGVMDAARSLFGNNLSGGELMKEMNDLLGSSSVNLMDVGQKDKFEKLLRDTKSMTHVAGVGIESVKGIIAEIKALGDSRLAGGLGGLEATRIASNVLGRTTAAMSIMDPSMVRLLGGQTGVASRLGAQAISSQEHPISQQLGALYYQAKTSGNTAMENYIANYARTGYVSRGISGFDEPQFQSFLRQAAGMSGQNMYQMINYANNSPLASRLGIEAMPELGQVGGMAEMQRVQSIIGLQVGRSPIYGNVAMRLAMGDTEGLNFATLNKQYGGRLNPQVIQRLIAQIGGARDGNNGAPLNLTQLAATLGVQHSSINQVVSEGGDVRALEMYNPAMITRKSQIASMVAFNSQQAKELSETVGDLNAPITQRLFQQLISGELSKEGLPAVMKAISGGYLAGQAGNFQMLHSFSLLDVNAAGQDTPGSDSYSFAEAIVGGGSSLLRLAGKKGMSNSDFRKLLAQKENGVARTAYKLIDGDRMGYADKSTIQKYITTYGVNKSMRQAFDDKTRGVFTKGVSSVLQELGRSNPLGKTELEQFETAVGMTGVQLASLSPQELAAKMQNETFAKARANLKKPGESALDTLLGMKDQFYQANGIKDMDAESGKDTAAMLKDLITAVTNLDGTLKGIKV